MGDSSNAAACIIKIIRVAAAVANRGVSEDEWERGGDYDDDDDDDDDALLNLVGSEGGASAAATPAAPFATDASLQRPPIRIRQRADAPTG